MKGEFLAGEMAASHRWLSQASWHTYDLLRHNGSNVYQLNRCWPRVMAKLRESVDPCFICYEIGWRCRESFLKKAGSSGLP